MADDGWQAVSDGHHPLAMLYGLSSILLLGAALRFHGLFANSFHADEALFASWARLIAVWRDPLLLTQAVDKPPLPFYLQAIFYPLFGPVEWAARMPAFIASLLLIPLTAQLARRLTGDRAAALPAAVFMAMSPLAIQFSATAFIDPLLVFWLAAALYAAAAPRSEATARYRGFLAGVLFGLALATKYQAFLFVPLLIGVGWLRGWGRREWLGGLAGVAVVLLPLLAWQWGRPGDLVALQWANIGGIRPARSWELWPRTVATVQLWRLAMGWPLVALSAAVAGALLWDRRGRFRLAPMDSLLLLFVSGYVLLHWLWAVPMWDRYLLPILPLVAVLFGRAVAGLWSAVGRRWPGGFRGVVAGALLVALLLLMPTALAARAGRFSIGGQPGADGGASRVALLLKDAPYGTVLYDHWYSWQWQYQLFDDRVYVSWFPHADALVEDLAVFAGDGSPRYLVLPSAAAGDPVARQLSEKGYVLERVGGQDEAADMTLYRIVSGESAR